MEKTCPGISVTFPAEITLASIYTRKMFTLLSEPTALANALIVLNVLNEPKACSDCPKQWTCSDSIALTKLTRLGGQKSSFPGFSRTRTWERGWVSQTP